MHLNRCSGEFKRKFKLHRNRKNKLKKREKSAKMDDNDNIIDVSQHCQNFYFRKKKIFFESHFDRRKIHRKPRQG